jgi:hypothetical protein
VRVPDDQIGGLLDFEVRAVGIGRSAQHASPAV